MFFRTFIAFALIAVVSCANGEPTSERTQEVSMRAGSDEPTLAERYDLAISLPMDETQFVELIQGIPLPIHRAGERGTEHPTLMRPIHNAAFDMAEISHGYIIDGGYQSDLHRNEMYRAYVNRRGEVVYVENAYEYSP